MSGILEDGVRSRSAEHFEPLEPLKVTGPLEPERAAALFRALASEIRLQILHLLAEAGELPLYELAAALGISSSGTVYHLAPLREERLVLTRRGQRRVFLRLSDHPIVAYLAPLLGLPVEMDGETES